MTFDRHEIRRRHVYADAALPGIAHLADGKRLLDRAESMSASLHKFLGAPEAAGVVFGHQHATISDPGVAYTVATLSVLVDPATEPTPPAQYATFGPRELTGVLTGPVPANPAVLARQHDVIDTGLPAAFRVATIGETAARQRHDPAGPPGDAAHASVGHDLPRVGDRFKVALRDIGRGS